MTYTNNVTAPRARRATYTPELLALSMQARQQAAERDHRRAAQVNTARASQHAEGREQARREVAIGLRAIALMEQGWPAHLANRQAEQLVDLN